MSAILHEIEYIDNRQHLRLILSQNMPRTKHTNDVFFSFIVSSSQNGRFRFFKNSARRSISLKWIRSTLLFFRCLFAKSFRGFLKEDERKKKLSNSFERMSQMKKKEHVKRLIESDENKIKPLLSLSLALSLSLCACAMWIMCLLGCLTINAI